MKFFQRSKNDEIINKKKHRIIGQEESLSFSSTKKETFAERIRKHQEKDITAKPEQQPLVVKTMDVKKKKVGFIDGLIGPISRERQEKNVIIKTEQQTSSSVKKTIIEPAADMEKEEVTAPPSEEKKIINLHEEKNVVVEQNQKQETEKGGGEIVSFSSSWRMPFLSTIITAIILFVIYMITILVKPDGLTMNIIGKAGVLPITKTMFILTPYFLLLISICCSLYWFRWLITRRYTITPQSVTIQYLLRKNKKIIIPINKIAIADKKIQNVFQKKLNTGDVLIFTYGSSHKRRFRLVNIPVSHEKVSLINEYSKKTQEEGLQKKIELITGTPKKNIW